MKRLERFRQSFDSGQEFQRDLQLVGLPGVTHIRRASLFDGDAFDSVAEQTLTTANAKLLKPSVQLVSIDLAGADQIGVDAIISMSAANMPNAESVPGCAGTITSGICSCRAISPA